MESGMEPAIISEWQPADSTEHCLELAMTDAEMGNGERVVAIRDTFDMTRPPLFATQQQVRNLVTAYEKGRLARMLGG